MLSNRTKSAFQSHFAQVPQADIQRSSFNRSKSLKTAIGNDGIIPIFVEEILPGDTINIGVNSFVRMNPTITPVMDNIWMDVHYFFVPNRLVWDNWQKFNGEQTDPGDSTDFLIPQATYPTNAVSGSDGFPIDSIGDFFGLPVNTVATSLNALPFRAYSLIINEWYRDQNLQDSLPNNRGDGPDVFKIAPTAAGQLPLYPVIRNKRHDYFTSCLPWPQKGPSVPIPSSDYVDVVTNNTVPTITRGADTNRNLTASATDNKLLLSGALVGSSGSVVFGNNTGLRADLTDNTEATINALRQAFQLQKLYERDARGGTRYTEIIRAHFGVISPDARLQRPEFLGGSSNLINMHPLAQTSESGSSPQGNLAGNGTLVSNTRIVKSFTEHGYVIGLVSLRGDLSYSQGVDRMWSRSTRWDFYWPALAHIGEQAVLNKELYLTGIAGVDDAVFGYQERYGEYRYSKSSVTNLMRPGVIGSLASWNLSQEFSGTPTLNSTFISSDTPLDRALIVPTEPAYLADFYFDFKHVRPMPTYSVPGLVDHF